MSKVLIIGSAIVDICMNLDRLPLPGEDVEARDEALNVGGCALNVARVLKACHIPCTLFVPVGDGRYGKIVERNLQAEGFDILLKVEGQDNGHCFALMEKNGERTFLTVSGVETHFEQKWFEKIDSQEYAQVFVGGYSLEGNGGAAIMDFLEENPQLKIFFGPGPRIMDIETGLMDRIFKLSPVLHVNEKESLDYTGEADVEAAARALFRKTEELVIITRGSRGAYFYRGGTEGYVPGEAVKVVNTSGAGDAHLGGLITALASGKGTQEAVRFANQISAAVVGKSTTGFEQGDL